MIKHTTDLNIINYFLSKFNTIYSNDAIYTRYMIYCVNDRPVGFLSYDLIFDRIEIEYIFVEEEYRKKDIGKSLLENLISESKKNNCLNITLEVRENNVPAINLYISKGFIGVSKRKKYYKDEDGILMIKEMH